MKDELKAKFFRDLVNLEPFQAQLEIEDQTYASMLNKMLTLDTSSPNLAIEYARLRGSLDAIKSLQSTRSRLVEFARQHNRETNS